MKYLIWLFLPVLLIWLLLAPATFADYPLPTFSSCQNPTGTVQADHPTGDHAIVGISGLQSGSDKVFDQENNNFTQCYCPISGSTGVKTDWLAAGGISKEDQNVLITQGWVYIANGANWGLSNQPYLAKNTEFSCTLGNGGGDSSGGGSASSSGSSGGGDSAGGSGGPAGDVLGISTLASTGNPDTKFQILFSLLLASSLILYGYKIQKKSK